MHISRTPKAALLLAAALLLPLVAVAAPRDDAQSPKGKKPQGPQFSCGDKRTCGEMDSCAEARFYLTQCGLKRLDRDKDGIPCEKLCG